MTPGRVDVVGLGENSVDLVYRLPPVPAETMKRRASGHRVSYGGQVATTLAACAELGLRTVYVGVFGSDARGRLIQEALHDRGVDTTHGVVRECPNRHAIILVEEQTGDRTVIWERDPTLRLTVEDVPRDLIAHARLLHIDDTEPAAALAAARIAVDAGVPVTCDIDQITEQTAALLAVVTTPILAEHVPSALTGEADAERALRQLRQTHGGLLCVTLGHRGALLLEGDRLHYAPAIPVETVDTTGAGDIFRGAFIAAMLRGDSPPDSLRFAVAAAAVGCTREGALDSVPTLSEVTGLLASAPQNRGWPGVVR